MSSPQVFSHGHAVVVGVGNDLPMTVTDATAVAKLLTDPARCGYPAGQVQLLVGGAALSEERPTRANILTALDGLADRCRADPDAIAVVYYSGHGGFRPEDGVYYLVPDGYDPNRFADTTVTGAEFAGKVGAVRARGMLVLLDCCHAAGLSGGGQVAKGGIRKAPIPPDLTALRGMTGRALVASCQANELSFGGVPYSFFTAALLEGLAGYGARQRDGKAHFIDVLGWIGHQVPKRSSDRQHPILDFSQVPINFPLAFYSGGDPQPKKLDWADPGPAAGGRPTGGGPPAAGAAGIGPADRRAVRPDRGATGGGRPRAWDQAGRPASEGSAGPGGRDSSACRSGSDRAALTVAEEPGPQLQPRGVHVTPQQRWWI